MHIENPLMGLVEKEKDHPNMKSILWWSRHEGFLEIFESFQWSFNGM